MSDRESPRVLVTGVAGFIGMHVAAELMKDGHQVVGVDSLNDYYDVALKQARLEQLEARDGFRFLHMDLADRDAVSTLFAEYRPTAVAHMAAQPGVRYSIDHPHAYLGSNLTAFLNILEGCRHNGTEHLVFASSSSVYGDLNEAPYREDADTEHPISLYAATKIANESMAHAYSHLYGFRTTGLRFFTVYGPWGRPDMAVYLFTRAMFEGRPIRLFNHGDTWRDYTYIDDVAEGVKRVTISSRDEAAPLHRIYNIGNHKPERLLDLVQTLEKATGRKAVTELIDAQPGDVYRTCADITALKRDFGFTPSTSIADGLARFVDWYRAYHNVRD
ncbi:SDR family NAD(P)-dependent oxidoreductase [Oricola sp.]|uniref:SDR family NAD(P)-dependent oxidoreductase n=1 Tax=Oricola sp. TaxID=1979950 RepID=UPI003BAAE211